MNHDKKVVAHQMSVIATLPQKVVEEEQLHTLGLDWVFRVCHAHVASLWKRRDTKLRSPDKLMNVHAVNFSDFDGFMTRDFG